jgi:hypothetical protein
MLCVKESNLKAQHLRIFASLIGLYFFKRKYKIL